MDEVSSTTVDHEGAADAPVPIEEPEVEVSSAPVDETHLRRDRLRLKRKPSVLEPPPQPAKHHKSQEDAGGDNVTALPESDVAMSAAVDDVTAAGTSQDRDALFQQLDLHPIDQVDTEANFQAVDVTNKASKKRRRKKEENYEEFSMDADYFNNLPAHIRNGFVSRLRKKKRMETDEQLAADHREGNKLRQRKHRYKVRIAKCLTRWQQRMQRLTYHKKRKLTYRGQSASSRLELKILKQQTNPINDQMQVLCAALKAAENRATNLEKSVTTLASVCRSYMPSCAGKQSYTKSEGTNFHKYVSLLRQTDPDSVTHYPMYPSDPELSEGDGDIPSSSDDESCVEGDGRRKGFMGRGAEQEESGISDYDSDFVNDGPKDIVGVEEDGTLIEGDEIDSTPLCITRRDCRAQGMESRTEPYWKRLKDQPVDGSKPALPETDIELDGHGLTESNDKIECLMGSLVLPKRKFKPQNPNKYKGKKAWRIKTACCGGCDDECI